MDDLVAIGSFFSLTWKLVATKVIQCWIMKDDLMAIRVFLCRDLVATKS
jgi:hypothetical protein